MSRLALGTMTFGTDWGWGADEDTARQLFNTYVDAGGNFIDTADLYTNGVSETWLGQFLAERTLRDRVVLATKFSYNAEPGNPNAGGNGRKNILRAVEGSLKRLNTDYIDLYILHTWDQLTPAEEVMRTLDDLVRSCTAVNPSALNQLDTTPTFSFNQRDLVFLEITVSCRIPLSQSTG